MRLGTRGSALAVTQSTLVADLIRAATGEAVELVRIRTEGDDLSVPLSAPSRPGAFVSALRDALLAGRVDVVVHSFKDLPSDPVPGITLVAVPARADSGDVLVTRDGAGLDGLPRGARVGTSSPRRAAALVRARPDLAIVGVRGNVDTRVSHVTSGQVDAVVLAAAGLDRLGIRVTRTPLPPEVVLPAPAQGALAVECRTGDPLASRLAVVDDPGSRLLVGAERAVLSGVAATCTTAVGAWARVVDPVLILTADLDDDDGYRRVEVSGPVGWESALALGRDAARRLRR